ncbi:DUF5605 domain-containing protein [Butyrivibrio sp. VCD2006]|uniref:DUF5605 domain-containing protein n=1 Tax=Butyrivibrio sp. VCD2006 TaxID=1280664 RepID=UPI00040DD6A8|nr:DUF5605 domain-containing protein [Butyrivibrio sp. VCD2006]
MSKHGMIKAVDTHFEYEDGTIFYPFGTTIYAFAHQTAELIEQTFESLKNSPFNKVRMCVFPKDYTYNKNEPEFYPFKKKEDSSDIWDVDSPCDDFWNHLESIIARLDDMEIQCDLILFHPYDRWGFSRLSKEDDLKYLQLCIDKLGHLDNIWWSLANEYDLLLSGKSLEHWYEIEEYLASHDNRHHLISNHNCFIPWDTSRPNITHGSYQTKRFPDVAGLVRKFGKPIMVDECCYEGNIPDFWGSISGEEMTARFWQVMVSGAYCTHGETFLDDNDILWWSKGGQLKGTSPARIAFLKEIVKELPGPIMPPKGGIPYFSELSADERKEMEKDPVFVSFMSAIDNMTPENRHMHFYAEHCYSGHCKNDSAIINYYYLRCCAKDTLNLPSDKKYNVEVIDTWNMTREVIAKNVSGKVTIDLPGHPYMAVIAKEV